METRTFPFLSNPSEIKQEDVTGILKIQSTKPQSLPNSKEADSLVGATGDQERTSKGVETTSEGQLHVDRKASENCLLNMPSVQWVSFPGPGRNYLPGVCILIATDVLGRRGYSEKKIQKKKGGLNERLSAEYQPSPSYLERISSPL